MPSVQGGRTQEVSSRMKLVKWLLGRCPDARALKNHEVLSHRASQES